MRFTLECQLQFLSEKRTEAYLNTMKVALQEKIVNGTKSIRAGQALLGGELMWYETQDYL
jgi:hypothetical protein